MNVRASIGRTIHMCMIVAVFLGGCRQAASSPAPIGVISGSQAGLGSSGLAPIAVEQQAGYYLASETASGLSKLAQVKEGNLKDDVQVAVRSLVESEQVIALVGATSNEATMRTASLVNFFNVPMLVPSAGGDNLVQSNNLWVFRISSPGSAYAEYMFGTVIEGTDSTVKNGSQAVGVPFQYPGLAIIYEENTFGESAAVSVAQAAMKQSIKIAYYGAYHPGGANPGIYESLVEAVYASGAGFLYLICSDPNDARSLIAEIKSVFGGDSGITVLGQEGGFSSQAYISSPDSDGTYVIRQAIYRTGCPDAIKTIYQAQSYGSMKLLEEAVKEMDRTLPPGGFLSRYTNPQTDVLDTRREKLRDVLKSMNYKAPCIGQVSFDNSGQNKNIQFELVQIMNGKEVPVKTGDFRSTLERSSGIQPQAATP